MYVCMLPENIYVYTELVFLTGLKHDWKPIFSCTELAIYEVVPVKRTTPFARNQVFLPVHWSSLERKMWYVRRYWKLHILQTCLILLAMLAQLKAISRNDGGTFIAT